MSHLNYFQAEADEINSTGHRLLDYVGGAVSLEMQMPKLLWLKVDSDNITAVLTLLLQRHRPDIWRTAAKFYDLADWLVHRATGQDTRSLCAAVCKGGVSSIMHLASYILHQSDDVLHHSVSALHHYPHCNNPSIMILLLLLRHPRVQWNYSVSDDGKV